jgi:hypothetical protein
MLQTVNEDVSHYDIFVSEITAMVKKIMGEEYEIRIYQVTKNNALELDSLVLLKKGSNFSPNIYLLPYYEEHLNGAKVKELAEKLCDTYHKYRVPAISESFTYAYEDIKDFIIYRLVSYERNRKLLEKIPYIMYLDMAITFHCLVREDNEGIGTIRITNEHMQMWKTSLQALHQRAVDNTSRLFPFHIQSMDEVILGMLGEDGMDGIVDEQSESILNDITVHQESDNHKMYILTNQKGINGASCLLYENVLKDFSKQIQSDFFILPSSIHEVILVPYDRTMTKEILSEMVKDVNHTQVARDEILSDNVYYYSRKKNTVIL